MKKVRHPGPRLVAVATAAVLALSACAGSTGGSADEASAGAEASSDTRSVVDMKGATVEVPTSPQAVVATDNRVFHTLDDWGIELVAGPVDLMPESLSYFGDDEVANLGNHREPNFELLVAAEPDLILNGHRFEDHRDEMAGLVPEAALVETSLDLEGEQLDDQLREQTTLLGQIFDKEAEADALIADFDASIERAKGAYDSEEGVVGIITSGGKISYAAPTTGRTIGPIYDVLELTPALDRDGSSNHEGDEISVEAIAQADPDWLIVLDRDAAASDGQYTTAKDLITQSEALQDVTAVREDQIIYLADDFYISEDIQQYTSLFNDIADAFEN